MNGWDQFRSPSAKWKHVPKGVPGAKGQCQRGALISGESRDQALILQKRIEKARELPKLPKCTQPVPLLPWDGHKAN